MDKVIDGQRVQVVGRRVKMGGLDVTARVAVALRTDSGDGLAREVAYALGGRAAALAALGIEHLREPTAAEVARDMATV